MGNAAVTLHRMTAQDFLAWDEHETIRHEFVRGEVFAMSGVDERHATVTLNVAMALRNHLRGTPCRTFMLDIKLRVEVADCFFYPDVFVTCAAADTQDTKIKRDPVLVVEVLSPSTAGYDRGDKFADYRRLPSLAEYWLIDPQTRRTDLFRKGAEGRWTLHPSEPGESVTLDTVGLTISAETLWDEVPLPEVAAVAGSADQPKARDAARRQSSPP